jgi:small-conductance mechanosensitive channel
MIDITGPKVLVPTMLFALLSPGMITRLPPNSPLMTQVLFHALVLTILSWLIINFVFKFTMTFADLVVPAILFIMLTPGVLLTIPPKTGDSGLVQVIVHAVVFSIVFASLRGLFPQFY